MERHHFKGVLYFKYSGPITTKNSDLKLEVKFRIQKETGVILA